jgi:replicative DNA helicase
MLSTQLINLANLVCVSDNKLLRQPVFKNLKKVLSFYRNSEDNIPLDLKLKFSLAETLCDLRLSGSSRETSLDAVKTTEKFVKLGDYIATMEIRELTDQYLIEFIKHINSHSKLTNVFSNNFTSLKECLTKFEQNEFATIDDANKAFETVLNKIQRNLSIEKREEDICGLRKLDLYEDDYACAVEQIRKNYSGDNSISTGYLQFDKYIRKGFEPGRLYIFAGKSGDGKSTLLINFLRNQLLFNCEDRDTFNIYLYVTLENHIDESLLRLYCCLNKISSDEVLNDWDRHKNLIRSCIREYSEKSKNIIVMRYFDAGTIGTTEIAGLCDEIREQYGDRGKLVSIFVDYLDTLKSNSVNYDMYRLELGQITTDLKVLCITQNVPVVTVTHLNRAAYEKDAVMSVQHMGEAMKKVERADFVAILRVESDSEIAAKQKETQEGDSEDCDIQETQFNNNSDTGLGIMSILIEKNRSGPKKKLVELRTDLSKFDISGKMENLNNIPVVSKQEITNLAPGSFL